MQKMHIPKDLEDQIRSGNCVLFIGSGLSLGAGLPTWGGLMGELLDEIEKQRGQEAIENKDEILQLIEQKQFLIVAEELRRQLGKDSFEDFLRRRFRSEDLQLQPAHKLLPDLKDRGISAILTTNFDTLIENAFSPQPPVYTQEDASELSYALQNREFYILKLHGSIHRISTIVLGQSDYQNLMYANRAYKEYLPAFLNNKTVLFVGYSLSDPDLIAVLDELRSAFQGNSNTHYALMSTDSVTSIEIRNWEGNNNIQVIPYSPSNEKHPEVKEYLENLVAKLADEVSTPNVPDDIFKDLKNFTPQVTDNTTKKSPQGITRKKENVVSFDTEEMDALLERIREEFEDQEFEQLRAKYKEQKRELHIVELERQNPEADVTEELVQFAQDELNTIGAKLSFLVRDITNTYEDKMDGDRVVDKDLFKAWVVTNILLEIMKEFPDLISKPVQDRILDVNEKSIGLLAVRTQARLQLLEYCDDVRDIGDIAQLGDSIRRLDRNQLNTSRFNVSRLTRCSQDIYDAEYSTGDEKLTFIENALQQLSSLRGKLGDGSNESKMYMPIINKFERIIHDYLSTIET